MYDELIHNKIEDCEIEKPIEIRPMRLREIINNFESKEPKNIILTGTAGDGKTYNCRLVWEYFKGDPEEWKKGQKDVKLQLLHSGKCLRIVKDLSELTPSERDNLLTNLAEAVRNNDPNTVYLVAANDGLLLASWRDFAESRGAEYERDFKVIEGMLVDEKIESENLLLLLYNLSHFDGSKCFQEIVTQITENPKWSECNGCPLLSEDGSTTCPIRINRDRLRGSDKSFAPFRDRLSQLLRLARANRMHLPIRDLLLLCVNIILGDHQDHSLLTCQKAHNRAKNGEYHKTNPYANAFGENLRPRLRQQYQTFSTLEAFGIGRETDNATDHLLIYGPYDDKENYDALIRNDPFYGEVAYRKGLELYLDGERENLREFMDSLRRQRQRLFFSLPRDSGLSPWSLCVYQSSGEFLGFGEKIAAGEPPSSIVEILVRGLNRTFCGMMIDDGHKIYLASSGGDGRGRISSILKFEIDISSNRRNPYLDFDIASDKLTPLVRVVDPTVQVQGKDIVIDSIELQISHFEYLLRVANGSLPTSFSRQCYEDFLDFKLRIIESLDQMNQRDTRSNEENFRAINVNEYGKPELDNIRILVDEE